MTEVSELHELLGSQASASVVVARVDRIVQWLREDVVRMAELVNALTAASKRDPTCGGASILVTESAANILKAFFRTKAAVDAFHSQAP